MAAVPLILPLWLLGRAKLDAPSISRYNDQAGGAFVNYTNRIVPMDDLTLRYIAFVVAVLILIWGVIQLNQRLQRVRKGRPKELSTWTRFDAASPDAIEDLPPDVDYDDQEETPEADFHVRAKQNGHHSESKKIT